MNIDGVVETGADERPIVPAVVIAKRSGHKIGVNPYVQKFVYHPRMNDADEISFTVNKFLNGELNPLWDDIKTFRLAYIPHYDSWFQLEVTIDDDDAVTKSVTGTHLQEAELSQLTLYLNINDDTDRLKDNYKPTKFYQPDDTAHSLLHRMLVDKASSYSIYHVDNSLWEDQREYTFNGKAIKDAFSEIATEVDCLFVFGESDADDGKIHRTISVYDLEDYCEDCGERGNFPEGKCTKCGSTNIKSGYGHDTTIYVDRDNLADNITYETNADKVKNCFHLEAGDDAMTAAVRNCNPDGSNYLWYFSDAMKAEMSDELQAKLKEYDNTYDIVTAKNETALVTEDEINRYNEEVDKYSTLNKDLTKISYPITGHTDLVNAEYLVLQLYDYLKTTMMPNTVETQVTTAQEQVATLQATDISLIGVANLKTLSTKFAEYSIKQTCALYVDTALYKVTPNTKSFDSDKKVWTGTITLDAYVTADKTEDQDTATTSEMTISFSEATPDYVKTKIESQLTRYKTNGVGIVALFQKDEDDFKEALKSYSLDNLSIVASADQAILDVLTDLGFGGDDANNKKWHDEYYTPYYTRLGYINDEITTRTQECAFLKKDDTKTDQDDGLFDILEKERARIRTSLDLKDFLGDELWAELNSFRRDDEYHNNNFVSDDLNQHEIIENAMKFYKEARKEIIKSATLQHTISADLYDLLIMPEFYPILQNFQLGNWLHLGIDGEVYKLRLIGYEIDFDDIDRLRIEFSDVVNGQGTVEDLKSILDQAASMATSYSATMRKANKGDQANSLITGMVDNGLDLTNRKIVNSADSQEVVQDEHGMLFRTRDDYGTGYNGEQTKIINSGLYYTDDSWETVKTGVGHFEYYDPEAKEYRDGYGVIADTLVGNLILGNGIGIYNTNNTFKADENGVTITGKQGGDTNQLIFCIRRENNDGTYTNFMTVNENGDLVITGNSIQMTGGDSLEKYIDNTIENGISSLNVILSNEFYAVTTDSAGNGGVFTNCYCTVTVLVGSQDVTDSSATGYTVTASDGVIGTWSDDAHTYTVTNLTADSGTVTFDVKYKTNTVSKVFTIKKIKQADSAAAYELYPSVQAIVKDNDDNLNPASITATAQMRTGTGDSVAYSGRYTVEESADGSTWETKYTSENDEQAMTTYTPAATSKLLRITLYKAGGTNDVLDQQTVPIVSDGDSPVDVRIDSSAGTIFKNGQTVTVLTCHVFRRGKEITDQVKTFNWIKYDSSGTQDTSFVRQGAGKSISITAKDVWSKAIFTCQVSL